MMMPDYWMKHLNSRRNLSVILNIILTFYIILYFLQRNKTDWSKMKYKKRLLSAVAFYNRLNPFSNPSNNAVFNMSIISVSSLGLITVNTFLAYLSFFVTFVEIII